MFELSTSRIANRRDHIEEDLRKRTTAFEEKLNDYMKEVESFKKKEVSHEKELQILKYWIISWNKKRCLTFFLYFQFLGEEAMRNNTELLATINENLERARDELEQINKEEQLLEWEQSAFPNLQTMFTLKEPYERLWNTAYQFHQKHEQWLNGN